jgi:hypothetical protein
MELLKKNGLLTADSEIKDQALVLAMYLDTAAQWDSMEDELDWTGPMIKKAEANGITISVEEHVADLKEEYDGEDGDWTDFDCREKVSAS